MGVPDVSKVWVRCMICGLFVLWSTRCVNRMDIEPYLQRFCLEIITHPPKSTTSTHTLILRKHYHVHKFANDR